MSYYSLLIGYQAKYSVMVSILINTMTKVVKYLESYRTEILDIAHPSIVVVVADLYMQ